MSFVLSQLPAYPCQSAPLSRVGSWLYDGAACAVSIHFRHQVPKPSISAGGQNLTLTKSTVPWGHRLAYILAILMKISGCVKNGFCMASKQLNQTFQGNPDFCRGLYVFLYFRSWSCFSTAVYWISKAALDTLISKD